MSPDPVIKLQSRGKVGSAQLKGEVQGVCFEGLSLGP